MKSNRKRNFPKMEYEQEMVCDVYNEIADRFNLTRGYKWGWVKEFMSTIPKNSLVYDIGCGSGRNMDFPDINFIGLDNCENFLKICREKGYNVVSGDMCKLPFLSESADYVTAIASFHHLSTLERRTQALNEFYRVLKPSGKLLVSVWSKEQPAKTRRVFDNYGDTIVKWDQHGDIFERYYHIFQLGDLKTLFTTCGFEIHEYKWDCGNEIFVLKKK